MTRQEKKYVVRDLEKVRGRLILLGAVLKGSSSSEHFYAQIPGNNVVKLVVSSSKKEIHRLNESDGRFSLSDVIPVSDKTEGLKWLKHNGFSRVSEVTMRDDDYEYKDGNVGLYLIGDQLKSIILEYEPGRHEEIEQDLGLGKAEVIKIPYNKYLESKGELKIIDL